MSKFLKSISWDSPFKSTWMTVIIKNKIPNYKFKKNLSGSNSANTRIRIQWIRIRKTTINMKLVKIISIDGIFYENAAQRISANSAVLQSYKTKLFRLTEYISGKANSFLLHRWSKLFWTLHCSSLNCTVLHWTALNCIELHWTTFVGILPGIFSSNRDDF